MGKKIFEADETPVQGQPQAPAQEATEKAPATPTSTEKLTDEDDKKFKDLISGGYEEFVKKLKGNKDPKIEAILNLGKSDGLTSDEVINVQDNASYSCRDLFPTQSQIGLQDSLAWLAKNKPEGAAALIKGDTSTFNENRILTANGKYILDGHHRWSQVFLFNPDAKIPAVNLVIPGYDEKQLLKIIQLAIKATYNDILMKPANSETDIFDDTKMSEKQIREKLPELMGEKMTGIAKTAYGLKTDEEVYDKITKNAVELKAKKPADAPARDFMPQPSDTASMVGREEEETKDFKGMPSEFINKIKSGDLNFKAPIKKESVRWVKTFEQFRKK
jgi:hypothetical protein